MRAIRFEKSGAFGRDRGGLPVLIEKPNRAMRRLIARQEKEMGRPTAPHANQLVNNQLPRK